MGIRIPHRPPIMGHDGRSITIYVIFTIRAAIIPECGCMGFVDRKFIELCLTKQKHSYKRVFLFGTDYNREVAQRRRKKMAFQSSSLWVMENDDSHSLN